MPLSGELCGNKPIIIILTLFNKVRTTISFAKFQCLLLTKSGHLSRLGIRNGFVNLNILSCLLEIDYSIQLYVVSKFVRKSDGKKKDTATKPASPDTGEISSTSVMSLHTSAAEGISLTGTPFQTSTPGDSTSPLDTETALKAVAAGLIGEESDGATLYTIVISQVCFKIGRITVPPGIVFAVNGFTGVSGHSLANPHPEWSEAERTMSGHLGGSSKKLKKFLAGGWKDIPESERWWDKSLGERIEAQRVKNISMITGLRKGLEKAREL